MAKDNDQAIYLKAKQLYDRQEYAAAATILTPLAENGNANAQYSLGYLYYNGLGTKRDLNTAYSWIKKAADSGQSEAIIALQHIRSIANAPETPSQKPDTQAEPMGIQVVPLPERSDTAYTSRPTRDAETDTTVHPDTNAPESTITVEPTKQDATFPPSYALSQEPGSTPGPEIETAREVTEQPDKPLSESETPADSAIDAYRNQSRKWIEQQPTEYHTIQIASFSHEKSTLQFQHNKALGKMYYFRNPSATTVWYSVIYGSFPTLQDARKELANARKQGYEYAWIRNFSDIQDKIKGQK